MKKTLLIVSILTATISAIDVALIEAVIAAPSQSTHTLLDQGENLYESGRYAEALEVWQEALNQGIFQRDAKVIAIASNYIAIAHHEFGNWSQSQQSLERGFSALGRSEQPEYQFLWAQLLSTKANGLLLRGKAESALPQLQQAASIYETLGEQQALIRTKINQTQALRSLGYYRRAQTKLEKTIQSLRGQPLTEIKVQGYHSLGQTLLRLGQLEQAQALLNTGASLAQRLNNQPLYWTIQLKYADALSQSGRMSEAISIYQLIQRESQGQTQLEARTKLFSHYSQQQQWSAAQSQLQYLLPQLKSSASSRWKVNTQIYLATILLDEVRLTNLPRLGESIQSVANLLATSAKQAKSLGDRQGEATAWGQLAHLYEQKQHWREALRLTDQAIRVSSAFRPSYVDAQWQWQRGRILKALNQKTNAIAAYQNAVELVDTLQQDLVALNPDVRFTFRDQVEPIYREYVQILLRDVHSLSKEQKQKRLSQSRQAIEALQLAELQNFFREACLTYEVKPISEIDPKAGIIYPILLEDRLEVIASLPNQPLIHYGVNLSQSEQESLFRKTRSALHPISPKTAIEPVGLKLYQLLLQPIEEAIAKQNLETLVFVPDGFLRNIPMAVMHDGDRFLLEHYNLALTPGLQLLNSDTINAKKSKILTAGLSDARQGFEALPGVKKEIQQIQQYLPSDVLLNQSFTKQNVIDQINQESLSIVHLATHGRFSTSADETFLLTWDGRINVKDFNQFFQSSTRKPIELLVLSACQTAEGDNRAALGMAGIAVRSGARSTIASLWNVQDISTSQLMTEFYRRLTRQGYSRSAALRHAQLSLLRNPKYQHPYYWSPFILLGNWQ